MNAKTKHFSTRFGELCRRSLDAHLTGRYAAARDHHMAEARFGNPELKETHVAFARSAHRAYLHSLDRALSC